MRSMTMPDTRGRTSETRVDATRPGSSRTSACGCGLTVTMLTSGSDVCAAATAGFGSSHPARNGAAAANINATYADRLRNPDIEAVAPEFEFGRGLPFHARRGAATWRRLGALLIRSGLSKTCCDATS